ncbi:hypothetical protein EMCRGX_G001364 [Ephydatia muelleri]
MKEGLLYLKSNTADMTEKQWIVNKEDQMKMILSCHDGKLHVGDGHFGREKTLQKICEVVQKTNPKLHNEVPVLHPIAVKAEVWHQVGIDLVGPLTCTLTKRSCKRCSNQPAEFEQDCEDDLIQEQLDEEEISQKQHYCKPGSQVQENEDKSTTGFEMEDNFVSIQNEDHDHTNTSVHKNDNADGKQKGQVIIADSTEKEHLVTLEKVMSRLGECGIKLKRTKCKFMLPSVEYLGYHISGEGISPTKEKRRAIVDAPVPEDISQLKSFWGLVNYYAKFLPCLADTLAPLYKLLTKHQPWSWGADQAAAFQKAKFQLTSDVLLVHFDPSKKIALSCDASPYGIGVVLSHLQEDGSDRPIAYASRSLAPAEKNYSQIEKEGLAVVWGVKKFHQFLFGRQFVVYSDHKPLQFLFSETKPVPTMASSRIQRWALTLSAYNYQMVFRPGKNQGNADGLSRLPLAEAPEEVPTPGDTILMLQAFSDMSSVVTATSIRRWTDKDPVLSVVRRMVLHGWRTQSNEQFKPYECRKSELSVEDGCILWGSRVVVLPPGRVPIIKILHDGHPGVSRMKSLARSVVWWPGLDAELEAKVKSCEACQVNSRSPPKSPLHPWEWPTKPWSCIHVDFCGPFLGKIICVMVDAHSKWLEAAVVSSTSSQQAIRVLRQVFSCHGLPEVLVSDNSTAFTSTEFQTVMDSDTLEVLPTTQPLMDWLNEQCKLLTPHSTTGRSPAELLLGRKPRSHLDFIFPSVEHHVTKNQERQKENHDVHTKRSFQVGEEVYVLNHRGMPKWIPGKVTAVRVPLTLIVTLDDGTESRYHVDHVKERITGGKRDSGTFQQPELDPLPTIVTMADRQAELPQAPAPPIAEVEPDLDPLEEEAPPVADLEAVPLLPRRSTRPHRPPERYGL